MNVRGMKITKRSVIVVLLDITIFASIIAATSTGLEFYGLAFDQQPRTAGNNPPLSWNTTWGGNGTDEAYNIVMNANGNPYVAGQTDSWTGDDEIQVWVAKFSTAGVLEWNVTWGGNGTDKAYDVAVDNNGNVFVSGSTDSWTGVNGTQVWVAKFSTAGVLQWNVTWGGIGGDRANCIAVDNNGNVFVAGSSIIWGDANAIQVWVAEFSAAGALEWNVTWGGTATDEAYDITVDNHGSVFVAGRTNSWTGTNGYDIWVGKFNVAGALLWNATWGGPGFDMGRAMAMDTSGNPYVGGYSDSWTGANGYDTWVGKFSVAGALLWNATWGGPGSDMGRAMAMDTSGNPYIGGYSDSWTGANGDDIWVGKFSVAGALLWNATWGGPGSDLAYGIVTDTEGNAYVAGSTKSWTSANGADVWVSKWVIPDTSNLFLYIIIIIVVVAAGIVVGALVMRKIRRKSQ